MDPSQTRSHLVGSSLGCLIQKSPLGFCLSLLISGLLFPSGVTFHSGEMQLSPQKQQLVPQQQPALLLLVPALTLCKGPPRLRALGRDVLHGPFGLHPLPRVGREEVEHDGGPHTNCCPICCCTAFWVTMESLQGRKLSRVGGG